MSYAATLKNQPEPFAISFSHASLLPIVAANPPPNFDPKVDAFISLEYAEAESLSVRWINSLIIKVVGKSFSVEFLKSSLQRIWKIKSPVQLIALGKGFYNVSLPSEEDRENVLSNGPWFITNFMVLVQPWTPGFKPSQATITKIPVWITLPELPIEFHSVSVLQKIASQIGTFIKTDNRAIEQNRVRFARIQVLLDLALQRKEAVWLGAFKQMIIYDETPFFCALCQSIDHGVGRCPLEIEQRKELQSGAKMSHEETLISDNNQRDQQPLMEEGEINPNPWINVSNKRTSYRKSTRKSKNTTKSPEKGEGRNKKRQEISAPKQKQGFQMKKKMGQSGKQPVLVKKVVQNLVAQIENNTQLGA
ncbi:uncharacterized protein [Spinacia oleracea]|uniref:DUF4283 domain-containing protein n=1 Tax=Spinacia oleracea TaxID=3562 RepID=A0ABM3RPF5_SPIOL|nr:uncharacterized protein LOC130471415 [Spinacia oleracea]